MYGDVVQSIAPAVVNLDCDQCMARLMNELKESEQYAQNTQMRIIEQIKELLEKSGDREDINDCLQAVVTKIKEDESEHWKIADQWGEHFTALSAGLEGEDSEEDDDDGPDDEEDEDESDEGEDGED